MSSKAQVTEESTKEGTTSSNGIDTTAKNVQKVPKIRCSDLSTLMRGGEMSNRQLQTMTFKYQDKLPPLPVPSLEDTLARFEKKVGVLIEDNDELQRTKILCQNFLKADVGGDLQERLLKRADSLKGKGSYVEEFWYKGYLAPRGSVVLNLNPFFVLEDDPTPERNEQVSRAASLVFSAVRFVWKLWNEELVADSWRGTPLDMSQYLRLFGACRIPHIEADEHCTFPRAMSRHFVVIAESQFFCVHVMDAEGNIVVDEASLRAVLEAILQEAAESDSGDRTRTASCAVGVFTTNERRMWAKHRAELVRASKINETSLQMIDSAMFVVCLDDSRPSTVEAMAATALHGSYLLSQDGTTQIGTCTNRWFDKLQMIVCGNGRAAINFEHTAVDGHTVLRFASDVFADTILRFAQSITKTTHGADYLRSVLDPLPKDVVDDDGKEGQVSKLSKRRVKRIDPSSIETRKLEWELTPSLRRHLFYAEVKLSDAIRQNETRVLEFKTFGKAFIVRHRMSPDAFVQLAIMASYYRLHGCAVNAYESVQTKHFFHGRTAAGRTMTAEAKSLCEVLVDAWDMRVQEHRSSSSSSSSGARTPCRKRAKFAASLGVDKVVPVDTSSPVTRRRSFVTIRKKLREALFVAAKAHVEEVRTAAKGHDVDRHLFALMCLAKERCRSEGKPLPALFESRAWTALNHSVLSTSNCGNPSLRLFGFGPVVSDGYGIGYIIKDGGLSFCVSSKNRQTDRYLGMLQKTLDLFRVALENPETTTPIRIRAKSVAQSGYGFFDSGSGVA
eukprot:g2444.t1